MHLTAEQQLELAQMPEGTAREVHAWIERLRPVAERPAEAPLMATLRRAARECGQPIGTFTRKWYAWRRKGWRGLVNQAKTPLDRVAGLPAPFIQFWRGLLEQHQRDTSGTQAHRQLLRQWRSWRAGNAQDAIPGYDTAPEPECIGFPRGWSLPNLRRRALTRYERALRHQGTMAAKNFLPSIRTTRVGLEFFSHLMFDDQWHDVNVNLFGRGGTVINRRAMRPLSFNALEVSSACDFARAYKPIIWDAVTQKREMLTEADFFWFLIHILTEFGWRGDIGTVFVHEHGTATINGLIREAITRATDGKVTFSTGGILGAPLRKGMLFGGQPRGNFKFKAHRESWFRLFREYCAHLPGATGRNRESAPEEQYGLLRHNNTLLRAMEKLGPQRAALLHLPLLSWHQFVPLADAIAEAINQRIDHDLEGWETLGRIAQEVRLSTGDERFLSLTDIQALQDPHAQQLALSLMDKPGHGRLRKLSPREVFDSGRADCRLTRLNPHLWNLVIPNEYAYAAKVTEQHEIIVRDRLITPEPIIFASLARTARGREEVIPAGTALRVYVNPFSPQRALVCEPDDAAIGLVDRLAVPCRADLDGMARAHGSVRHLESLLQRESARRAEAVMTERAAMREHNARVLDGTAVTEAERAAEETADAMMDQAPALPAMPDEQEPEFDPLDH